MYNRRDRKNAKEIRFRSFSCDAEHAGLVQLGSSVAVLFRVRLFEAQRILYISQETSQPEDRKRLSPQITIENCMKFTRSWI